MESAIIDSLKVVQRQFESAAEEFPEMQHLLSVRYDDWWDAEAFTVWSDALFANEIRTNREGIVKKFEQKAFFYVNR